MISLRLWMFGMLVAPLLPALIAMSVSHLTLRFTRHPESARSRSGALKEKTHLRG